MVSLLTGRAREWGTAIWDSQADCCDQYVLFKEEMVRVFARSAYSREASRLLAALHQGKRTVADFSIEFRTPATTCGWNKPALVAHFLEGLNADIKNEIFSRKPPAHLDQLISLAIRLDKRF